ncbi:NAD(P)-dependent oxidoreductase [Trichococcus sp. K1Tr]|jgi:3-hydroxyisobutyrate dehydrogenase|uniref:NAD(P)-dependent oxidoreductase n=1 Tax=Trichococcus sp. K1Tr TaxID=3020847 RepID=UPI00233029CA|nr:NAD(P)-dependent oxidoreductase [Trichococcus sp. K1Tr]MDB6352531.1 NAD(P)-dependent oxidoreductase [Trichococcus sp. K1Tr]
MEKIGFIGTGVMGSSMIRHLLNAGYPVHVYNRTKSRADAVIAEGAKWCDTPADVTAQADIVITIVGYPTDVEETYFGETGIFSQADDHHILIDMTTSTPTLAEKIYAFGKEKGIATLDAPVSGGDKGAQNGTLTTMVGGDQETFDAAKQVLSVFSSKVMLQGPAGSGQHTKMANQIMVAGTMTGMTELLVYSKAAGLDLERVIEQVGSGSAANWSLTNYGPRILKQDYTAGFFVKHFVKDLKIALDEAEKMGIDLPATKQAALLYEQLAGKDFADDGTQALVKLWWGE